MPRAPSRPWPWLMALVASLAACGGGGSDDNGGGGDPGPGAITISGKATYESVPPQPQTTSGVAGPGLSYAGAADKPIRGATVQLLAAGGTVLATTTTDTSGNYAFALDTSQAVTVRVRAEIKRSGSATGDRDFSVLDNTGTGTPLYVLDSAAFTPTGATTQNVRAASGWSTASSSYAGTRAAAPFAILDTVYSAQDKIASVAVVNLPVLKIYWSINNKPASGNATTGNIITTFFTSCGDAILDSSASCPAARRALFILGAADTDTDEFDSHVIAHEFGHYVQSAISRDDSPGGSHGSGDKLDYRLAFSEGWGNGWSGIALADPVYIDTYGMRQSRSFSFNVSVAATGTDRGAYSETTGQYLVWTANQTYGFGTVFPALTRFPSSPAFSTLYNFADSLKAIAPASATAITTLFATQNIVATDAFGTGETNDGGVPTSLPVYKAFTAGTPLCVTGVADPGGDNDKLGEYMYLRFAASGSKTLTLTNTSKSYSSPTTTDPDFTLLQSTGSTVDANSSDANVESLSVSLPTGTHAVAFQDYNLPSNQTSCFVFAVN